MPIGPLGRSMWCLGEKGRRWRQLVVVEAIDKDGEVGGNGKDVESAEAQSMASFRSGTDFARSAMPAVAVAFALIS